MSHEVLNHVPLLVFANMQDKEGAASINQITEKLRVSEVCGTESTKREWHVQGCSAHSGNGLTEGLDWIADVIQAKQ